MIYWFRKKEKPEGSPAKERFAVVIANKILVFQRKWADYMQAQSEKLSSKKKKAILILFVFGCCIYCAISIYAALEPSRAKMDLGQISSVPISNVLESTEPSKISDKEFMAVQRFKVWLDSLSNSPDGRDYAKRLLRSRPGLMDSINTVEEIYRRQHMIPKK